MSEKTGSVVMPVVIPLASGLTRIVHLTVPCTYLANGEELLDGYAIQALDLCKAANMLADAAKTLAFLAQSCPTDTNSSCPNSAVVRQAAAAMNEVLLKVEPVLSDEAMEARRAARRNGG